MKQETIMSVRSFLIAGLWFLGIAGPAGAATGAEEAYEVRATTVTLPSSEFGSLILRTCDDCESVTLRVDGDTRYIVAGRAMPLTEFRALMRELPGKQDMAVTVLYRPGDRRVTRVLVPGSTAAP